MSTEEQPERPPQVAPSPFSNPPPSQKDHGEAAGWLDMELKPLAESEWRPQLRWEREEEVSLIEIIFKRLSFRGWMLPSVIPALIICSALPMTLAWVFMMGRMGEPTITAEGLEGPARAWDVPALINGLKQYGAGGACFAGIFAVGLMAWMRSYPRETPYREYPHYMTAAYFGTILSFFNVSAYYAFTPLYAVDILCPLRFCILSIWCGMIWGGWVGWASYRENHHERGWIPRITLMNFFAIVGGLALVAILFLPSFLQIAPAPKERPHIVRPWERRTEIQPAGNKTLVVVGKTAQTQPKAG